ncbi:leucine-rich repeat domain, L domain-like protein [Artemisia annua]|uniref:Leucine-rich repeat domain, L domain-like protein n=1 Tax=Artemisia annua TaxID=35608 RepID=A0A2U1L324_ARTAN|nr:leucine-rich repeat domain, L domain-like protein [Artemisia annua]
MALVSEDGDDDLESVVTVSECEFILRRKNIPGESAENQCVILQLQDLEIPKGFTPCLRDGSKCTLQLPENWCSDFCGFLMCAVLKNDLAYLLSPGITIKQVTDGLPGMDSEDDVVWKENVGDEITCVWYVPFASLRHTNWWDSTYKKLSFSFYIDTLQFGVRLARRKGGSGPTETSTDSAGISFGKDYYTTGFKIFHDSKYYLQISPSSYYCQMILAQRGDFVRRWAIQHGSSNIKEVVNIINSYPEHDIIIGIDSLGKEDLLLYISKMLKIKVILPLHPCIC